MMLYNLHRGKVARLGLIFALLTILYIVCFSIDYEETKVSQKDAATKNVKVGIANYTQILFLETSGTGTIGLRFISSVESAARYNPKKKIYVMLICDSKPELTKTMEAIQKRYSNIQYEHITGDQAFRDTALYEWYKNHSSIFKTEHVADALRYITLWKQGNIYLDLDVLSLKELRLPKNVIVSERIIFKGMTNALLAFEKHHPFVKRLVDTFQSKSSSYHYTKFGNDHVKEEYWNYCGNKGNKCDVVVLPEKVLLPMGYWKNLNCFFTESCTEYVLNKTAKSMVIHWFNKLAANVYTVRAGMNIAYLKLVERHAPITYAAIQEAGVVP